MRGPTVSVSPDPSPTPFPLCPLGQHLSESSLSQIVCCFYCSAARPSSCCFRCCQLCSACFIYQKAITMLWAIRCPMFSSLRVPMGYTHTHTQITDLKRVYARRHHHQPRQQQQEQPKRAHPPAKTVAAAAQFELALFTLLLCCSNTL